MAFHNKLLDENHLHVLIRMPFTFLDYMQIDRFIVRRSSYIVNLNSAFSEGSDTIRNHVDGFRNLHESCQESWNHRNLKIYKLLDYP